MSPRALTAPPTDRSMWRRLLARAHPDSGGNHELFIWTEALRDAVLQAWASAALDPPPRREQTTGPAHDGERVPYEEAFGRAGSFAELTRQAVAFADYVGEPHATLLWLLSDCLEAHDGPRYRQQHQGATYKQLAYIAHLTGMGPEERRQWYRIAESIPLSQRHAGHLIQHLQRSAA